MTTTVTPRAGSASAFPRRLKATAPCAVFKWESANLDEFLPEGETRTNFLLRFTLNHPGMSTNIVGTKNPQHLRENIAAASRGPLPQDVYEEAKRRLDVIEGDTAP